MEGPSSFRRMNPGTCNGGPAGRQVGGGGLLRNGNNIIPGRIMRAVSTSTPTERALPTANKEREKEKEKERKCFHSSIGPDIDAISPQSNAESKMAQ